jgi:hypothetical protein
VGRKKPTKANWKNVPVLESAAKKGMVLPVVSKFLDRQDPEGKPSHPALLPKSTFHCQTITR